MSNPIPTFSFASLLDGSYGVDSAEEVARVRALDRAGGLVTAHAVAAVISDEGTVSLDESVADDDVGPAPVASCSSDDVVVTFMADDVVAMDDDELRSVFESLVRPVCLFGSVSLPMFDKGKFISCVAMSRVLALSPSKHTLKGYDDLVRALYLGESPLLEVVAADDTDSVGYVFTPTELSPGFEPPPICSQCDLIAYQCPCHDFDVLKMKALNEMSIADDYCLEGLTGVVDNETLLSNLGPFLLPIHCEYSRAPGPVFSTSEDLSRPTDRVEVELLQAICDTNLPTHVNFDDTYHQLFVDNADYAIDIDKVRFKQTDLVAPVPGGGHLEPVLNTGSSHKRVGTQKEVLTAIKKRNADVPELGDSLNLSRMSRLVAEKFMKSFVVDDALLRGNFINVVGNFHAYMEKWSSVLSYDDLPDLNAENLQFYEHMIKSDVKPTVTDTLNVDRPVPATITFHRKTITSQFSPLFISLFERFQRCLSKRIVLPVGKISSLEIPGFSVDGMHCLEVDLSKFDKSQGEFHLMIQEHILNFLGCPAHITKWWCDFHRFSFVKDKRAGVSLPISFQRRTGDAFTYFGNTLVTMAEFAWCYDVSQFEKAIFSGDDSLAFSRHAPVGDPSKFTTMFNMEAKVMEPAVPYICSKFLLTDEFGNTFSVPDPLRELQRLGCKKIPVDDNDSCLHAHFMSFVDRLKFMDRMSQRSIDQLRIFFELKYRKSGDEAALILGAFKKYTANFKAYRELYFSDRHQCDMINSFTVAEFRVGRGKSKSIKKKKTTKNEHQPRVTLGRGERNPNHWEKAEPKEAEPQARRGREEDHRSPPI
ncbi:MAG: RNA-dependent RNA polymerase [Sichuan bromovirus]|nr:MAG: RNA-dependent RNA polymerase [Sichuan bromovirus]